MAKITLEKERLAKISLGPQLLNYPRGVVILKWSYLYLRIIYILKLGVW